MQPIRRHLLITACLFLLAGIAQAQRMPQDSWYFSHSWVDYSFAREIAVSSAGLVFIPDVNNDRIKVFDQDGNFIRQWGSSGSLDGQFQQLSGIAVSSEGLVFAIDNSYSARIQVFDQDGNFIRKWGSSGSLDGQFKFPYGIAVSSEGLVFVTDTGNNRIQVFDQDGNFIRQWGSSGSLDGQFQDPRGIGLDTNGRVLVSDSSRFQVFDQEGNFKNKWSGGAARFVIMPSGLIFKDNWSNCIVLDSDGTVLLYLPIAGVAGVSSEGVVFASPYGRTQAFMVADYRNHGQHGVVPMPLVKNVAQRPGTPYLDVDYVVRDSDSTNVTVAAAAFKDGVDSLNNFIGVRSFVDGTESAIGSNVLANVTNRFTWNVAADWQADYVNLKVRMMAQDERGLMSVGFITLPENVTNSLPALTISQSPITQSDMLPLWYWLLARGDEAVELKSGGVWTDVALSPGGANGENGPNGLKAEYFDNKTFAGDPLVVVDDGIRFTTSGGLWPYSPLSPTNFSARWSGVVVPEFTETYTLSTRYLRGGVRLWVNGQLLVNYPNDAVTFYRERSGSIALEAGVQYEMVMEYRYTMTSGTGVAELQWSSPSLTKRFIPYQSFFTGPSGEGTAGALAARGTLTTQLGRGFLFSRMGVREATAAELTRAKTGPAGVVNQWSLREGTVTAGPGDRPKRVNEYGFDTGNWGTDGWWVVKE